MTATVIGVDGSLTATGLAVWRDGRIHLQTIRTTPAMGDKPTRWRHIVGRIWPHVTPHTLAVIEDVHQRRGPRGQSGNPVGSSTMDLAALHAVVLYGFHARSVPMAHPTASQVKKYATGSGNAPKEHMVAAARETLGHLVGDDNQADALWLMAMGLHWYGLPLVNLPVVQAHVLDRVEWPQLDARPWREAVNR